MNISQLIYTDRLFSDVIDALDQQSHAAKPLPLIVNGLTGGSHDAFCIEIARAVRSRQDAPTLFLAPDEHAAATLCSLLCSSGLNAVLFPRHDPVLYEYAASHEAERERLFALRSLLDGTLDAVVATPAAATGFTIPKSRLAAASVALSVEKAVSPLSLCQNLTALGYTQVELVEGAGQYARRGGILDLWCDATQNPVRIEFFGDEIDRLCYFDPLSQRLLDACDSITLLPAHEVLLDEQAKQAVKKSILLSMPHADESGKEELSRSLEALESDRELLARDRYISLIYPEKQTLLDYLPARAAVIFLGTNEIAGAAHSAYQNRKEAKDLLCNRGVLPEKEAVWELAERAFFAELDRHPCLHINAFTGGTFQREGGVFGFRCRRLPSYADTPKAFTDDLAVFLKEHYSAFVLCESKTEVNATVAYCNDLGIPAIEAAPDLDYTAIVPDTVYVLQGTVSAGFELTSARVAVLSLLHDNTIQNRRNLRPIKRKKHSAGQTILSYAELHPGDYVVHEKYGIGKFEGLESLTQNGITRDYITIHYAGTDKLFIPADRLESVTKYIGSGADGNVKLSQMGSVAWTKAKNRAKGATKEMAQQLIALYAARQKTPGISFEAQPALETEFANNFEYPLTEAQQTAVTEILSDMSNAIPMDRLLCGDVGFGKTEVALRAAFRAVANGRQVAILVPTTILALQHYQTILARMRGFAVSVDMLSRFRSPREQATTLRRVARGETDIIIGTHALLGHNVSFKKLGLLIIDEEQRFGVGQKERIKGLASDIDVLSLTATPIPRTLNMAMSGIRDMSVLDEAPGERRPVETYVLEHNEDVLYTAIRREIARAGQVLYLYNRTEHIDLVAGKLQNAFPNARIAYAHGQMERESIEDIWQALVRGEIDILVCTTIIETGVDLPNANTLIIENADRFGLAQLHQIRGRIGRSSRQAYAYLTYRVGKALSEVARKRLEAIREYAEFGAGFRIALRDLEIRGAGDLLGAAQHGQIESVGYDLYVRLLESAILEEQGKAPAPVFESTIDLHVDANIPEGYIASSAARMEMYKKISCIATEEDRQDVLDEFCDRYGDPPKATQRLLYIALARATAERCRISSVERVDKDLLLLPQTVDLAVWAELFVLLDGFRSPTSRSPQLAYRIKAGVDPAKAAADVLRAYERAIHTVHKGETES